MTSFQHQSDYRAGTVHSIDLEHSDGVHWEMIHFNHASGKQVNV